MIPAPFEARLRALQSEISGAGADLYLLDHGELMAWLTGYTWSETMYRAVLVPASGMPWIVLRQLDAHQAAAQGWIRDIRGFPDWADPFGEVAEAVVAHGHRASRIAVDSSSYSYTAHAAARFAALLPEAEFLPLPGISDRLRMVKDETEIALLRRAAGIADRTMKTLGQSLRPGDSARRASAIAAHCFLSHGADEGQVGPICRGDGGTEFLHSKIDDAPLAEGEILHVELVPRVGRYSARLMRPIALGKATPEVLRVAARLFDLQDAQIAAMADGAVAADVDAVMRDGALNEGLRKDYLNVTGYTLGIYGKTPRSSDFSHVFLPTSRWQLRSGMVFHMYTSAAGLGISETVLVTPDGGERLTKSPRQVQGATGATSGALEPSRTPS